MSLDLRDLRCKVPVTTWAYLEAHSRASGRDICEIVREQLGRWASAQHHAATIASRLLEAEGLAGTAGESRGRAGKAGAPQVLTWD